MDPILKQCSEGCRIAIGWKKGCGSSQDLVMHRQVGAPDRQAMQRCFEQWQAKALARARKEKGIADGIEAAHIFFAQWTTVFCQKLNLVVDAECGNHGLQFRKIRCAVCLMRVRRTSDSVASRNSQGFELCGDMNSHLQIFAPQDACRMHENDVALPPVSFLCGGGDAMGKG